MIGFLCNKSCCLMNEHVQSYLKYTNDDNNLIIRYIPRHHKIIYVRASDVILRVVMVIWATKRRYKITCFY